MYLSIYLPGLYLTYLSLPTSLPPRASRLEAEQQKERHRAAAAEEEAGEVLSAAQATIAALQGEISLLSSKAKEQVRSQLSLSLFLFLFLSYFPSLSYLFSIYPSIYPSPCPLSPLPT